MLIYKLYCEVSKLTDNFQSPNFVFLLAYLINNVISWCKYNDYSVNITTPADTFEKKTHYFHKIWICRN